MPGELGESQLSSLLESVPGLASVLRSPVADAIVNMIRAAAGLRDFDVDEARELVQYATRRGLIPQREGNSLLEEVVDLAPAQRRKRGATAPRRAAKKSSAAKSAKAVKKGKAKAPVKAAAKKKVAKKKTAKKKTAKKKTAKKTSKASAKGSKAAKKKRR
jgi:hypothetical protein